MKINTENLSPIEANFIKLSEYADHLMLGFNGTEFGSIEGINYIVMKDVDEAVKMANGYICFDMCFGQNDSTFYHLFLDINNDSGQRPCYVLYKTTYTELSADEENNRFLNYAFYNEKRTMLDFNEVETDVVIKEAKNKHLVKFIIDNLDKF